MSSVLYTGGMDETTAPLATPVRTRAYPRTTPALLPHSVMDVELYDGRRYCVDVLANGGVASPIGWIEQGAIIAARPCRHPQES